MIERGLAVDQQPHPLEVPVGVPSQLLERRPDVQQAEASLICKHGVPVDHATIYRWVKRFTPEIEERLRWRWCRPQSTS